MAVLGALGRGLLRGSLVGAGAGVGLGVNPWLGMGITGLAGKVRAPIRGGEKPDPKSVARAEPSAKQAVKPSDDFHTAILKIDKTILANYEVSLKNNAGIKRIQQMLAGPGAARAKEMRMESGMGGAPPIIMLGGPGAKEEEKGGFPWWAVGLASMIAGTVLTGIPPMRSGGNVRRPPHSRLTKYSLTSLESRLGEKFKAFDVKFERLERLFSGDPTKGRGPKGGRSPFWRLRSFFDTRFTAFEKSFIIEGDPTKGRGPKGGKSPFWRLRSFFDTRFSAFEKAFFTAEVDPTKGRGPKGGRSPWMRLGSLFDIKFERLERLLGGDPTKGRGPKGGINAFDRLYNRLMRGFGEFFKPKGGPRVPPTGAWGNRYLEGKFAEMMLEFNRFSEALTGERRGPNRARMRLLPGRGYFDTKFGAVLEKIFVPEKGPKIPVGERISFLEAELRNLRTFLTGQTPTASNRARYRISPGKGFFSTFFGEARAERTRLGNLLTGIGSRLLGIETKIGIDMKGRVGTQADWFRNYERGFSIKGSGTPTVRAGEPSKPTKTVNFNQQLQRWQALTNIEFQGLQGGEKGTTESKTIKKGQIVSTPIAEKLAHMQTEAPAKEQARLKKAINEIQKFLRRKKGPTGETFDPSKVGGGQQKVSGLISKALQTGGKLTRLPFGLGTLVGIALLGYIMIAYATIFIGYMFGTFGAPGTPGADKAKAKALFSLSAIVITAGVSWWLMEFLIKLVFGFIFNAVGLAALATGIGIPFSVVAFAAQWWAIGKITHEIGLHFGFIEPANEKEAQKVKLDAWKYFQSALAKVKGFLAQGEQVGGALIEATAARAAGVIPTADAATAVGWTPRVGDTVALAAKVGAAQAAFSQFGGEGLGITGTTRTAERQKELMTNMPWQQFKGNYRKYLAGTTGTNEERRQEAISKYLEQPSSHMEGRAIDLKWPKVIQDTINTMGGKDLKPREIAAIPMVMQFRLLLTKKLPWARKHQFSNQPELVGWPEWNHVHIDWTRAQWMGIGHQSTLPQGHSRFGTMDTSGKTAFFALPGGGTGTYVPRDQWGQTVLDQMIQYHQGRNTQVPPSPDQASTGAVGGGANNNVVVYNEGPRLSSYENLDFGAALASDTSIPNTGTEGQRRAWS